MDLTRPSLDRRALLRDELPSDPDAAASHVRLLCRDRGRLYGSHLFWEPRNWRFVDAPERPSWWRRVMAWLGQ